MNLEIIVGIAVFVALFACLIYDVYWSRKVEKVVHGDINMIFRCLILMKEAPIAFLKLDPAARLPAYAHDRDSGMDVTSIEAVDIPPGKFAKIRTGIAAKIPLGFEIQVRPRSGLQTKYGIVGAFGTIDEGYRGEIGVTLYNHSTEPYHVAVGDRVAQLVVSPVCRAKTFEVDKFEDETDRGAAGFGSTGK